MKSSVALTKPGTHSLENILRVLLPYLLRSVLDPRNDSCLGAVPLLFSNEALS